MVCSSDGDTVFFGIVAWVLLRDTLIPYNIFVYALLRHRTSNISRSNKRKWFHIFFKKTKSRRYAKETLVDAGYIEDRAILANTPAQAEYHLHNREQAAGSNGLFVNGNKTYRMCFKQKGVISTRIG